MITLIQLALGVASKLLGYAQDRQLIEAGAAQAAAAQLKGAQDAIRRAADARRAVSHDPDSVRDDPHNRDRRG